MKNILVFTLSLIFIQQFNTLKVDSGFSSTTYHWNSGHYMTNGNGYRYVQKYIPFTQNFTSTPKLVTSLNLVDSYHARNLRVHCDQRHVSKHGFVLRISTWADTRIYAVKCSYVAHGNQ